MFPWTRSTRIDYHVTVAVSQFDADPEGVVTLVASWRVLGRDDAELIVQRFSTYTEAAGSTEHTAVASAHNRALNALSRDIAAVIRETASQ